MFLLDTDIATLAQLDHARVSARMAAVDPAEIGLPLATRLEILRGRIDAVFKAANVEELLRACERLADSDEFLAEFSVFGVDMRAAAYFDRLRANKKLKKMDRGDLLNACVALAHGATQVTRNTKDSPTSPA